VVSYRCNFLTSEGKVFCVEDVEGEADNHAMEKIRRLMCSDLDHAASFERSGEEKFWSIRRDGKAGERACRRRAAGSALLQARGTPMDRTFADVEADIASLRANVAKYRKRAEECLAHGQLMIAQKQMEFVADLEARLAALEAVGDPRRKRLWTPPWARSSAESRTEGSEVASSSQGLSRTLKEGAKRRLNYLRASWLFGEERAQPGGRASPSAAA
jgi:hypothetical protein